MGSKTFTPSHSSRHVPVVYVFITPPELDDAYSCGYREYTLLAVNPAFSIFVSRASSILSPWEPILYHSLSVDVTTYLPSRLY